MNTKILFFSTFCSAFLMASTTALSQISIIQNSVQSSTNVSINEQGRIVQSQTTVISVDSTNMSQPYILRISAPEGTQLTGQVTLNGRVITELKDNQTEINISPLLSKGTQTIKISGTYQPAQSSVKIEISGPNTQLSQETSGYGILDQSLIINVQ